MKELLDHFDTKLKAITKNIGTDEDPELVAVLNEVDIDNGQLEDKVTLQLPAAYYDITDMAYSQSGDNVGVADTEITVRMAVKKNDTTRYDIINAITKAMVGSGGTTFNGIVKESQKKVSYDDIFEYRITFGCALFDASAVPEREEINKPEAEFTVLVQR